MWYCIYFQNHTVQEGSEWEKETGCCGHGTGIKG